LVLAFLVSMNTLHYIFTFIHLVKNNVRIIFSSLFNDSFVFFILELIVNHYFNLVYFLGAYIFFSYITGIF
jgi:hypothetical protein